MQRTFKFLSYNIHRGMSTFRRADVSRAIADLLIAAEPDVVCLQEVWQQDGISEHQLEQLCDDVWSYQVFRKNAVFPHGAQGNAILSRLPILRSHKVDISVGKLEARGFLHVDVSLPHLVGKLSIICLHLGLFHYERVKQLRQLERYIETHVDPKEPLIVAGDFNDWRGKDVQAFAKGLGLTEAIEEKYGSFGKTYPSFMAMLPLDRMYFRRCEVISAQVVKYMNIKNLSDHLPIEAIFAVDLPLEEGALSCSEVVVLSDNCQEP